MVNKIEKQVIPDSPKILLKQAIAVHVDEEKFGTVVTINGKEQATWNADEKADVEEVESVREETNMLWDEVFIIYDDLNHASTRLANVEQDTKLVKEALFQKGIIARAEVEQAYTSRVTADGQNIVDGQKTPVTLIKGSTKRCENLWDIDSRLNNVLVKNANGSYTLTKSAAGRIVHFYFDEPIPANTTITFSVKWTSNFETTSFFANAIFEDGTGSWLNLNDNSTSVTKTFGQAVIGFYIYVTNDVPDGSSFTFTEPMFNIGQPLPYQPYFTDLKHAKIDSIVSTGRNLLNRAQRIDGIAATGRPIFKHERYSTFYFHAPFNTDVTLSCGNNADKIYVSLSNSLEVGTLPVGNTAANRNKSVSINTQQYKYVLVSYWAAEGNAKPDEVEIWANVGTSTKEYTPFVQETYQLPETLELDEWDSFNPQTGEITRATSKIVLTGEEAWMTRGTLGTMDGDLYRNYIYVDNPNAFPTASEICAVSNLYNGVTAVDTYNRVTGVSLTSNVIDVYDPNFATNDISLWKQYLRDLYAAGTPLIVEYKLATPTVEKLEYAPKSYTAYNQGNEAIVNENGEFGAIPTITNEYIVVL